MPNAIVAQKAGCYKVPHAFQTLEDYQKAENEDLAEADDVSLFREELRTKIALANLDPDRQPVVIMGPLEFVDFETWLIRRLAAIRKERARRQSEVGHNA